MEQVDKVTIIPASPMASRVARLSQERTSIVATEGSVGCVDNELSCTAGSTS